MGQIKFVVDDENAVLLEEIAALQSIMGRTIGNADPEMLLINAFALRVANVKKQLNWTGNQNLISNATLAALEELGHKNGTFRLDPSAAVVTIQFSISGGAPTLTIPAGKRVKSQDGAIMFATKDSTVVTSGTATVNIDCVATIPGVIGNGYAPGFINILADSIPYVTAVSNTNTSGGGANAEIDDRLRVRIPLANATYSVAGSVEGYEYFAKTASPAIVDVKVIPDLLADGIGDYAINAAGTGYVTGDIFTINGGTTLLSKGKVLTVDGSGGVLTFQWIRKGAGYSTATGVATTAVTGAGAGLTIDIVSVLPIMTIQIYSLLQEGALPNSALLDAIEDICSDKKIRPLSDNVAAFAPTATNYSLTVNLTMKKGYNSVAAVQQVSDNLNAFVNQWDHALDVDLIVNQFRAQCMVAGVYDVAIPSFTVDVTIDKKHFGNCTGVTVSVVNIVDEP
jgi:phage-related baseplate assembly protein